MAPQHQPNQPEQDAPFFPDDDHFFCPPSEGEPDGPPDSDPEPPNPEPPQPEPPTPEEPEPPEPLEPRAENGEPDSSGDSDPSGESEQEPSSSETNEPSSNDELTQRETEILREAEQGKGNFGIGKGTIAEADKLGKEWVGEGYRVASDGKTLVSDDGLRQYRPPSRKQNSPQASTGVQANFESRTQPSGRWTNNGHLDIVD